MSKIRYIFDDQSIGIATPDGTTAVAIPMFFRPELLAKDKWYKFAGEIIKVMNDDQRELEAYKKVILQWAEEEPISSTNSTSSSTSESRGTHITQHSGERREELAREAIRVRENAILHLKNLIKHMSVHSNYPSNGFSQMDLEQKCLYNQIVSTSQDSLDREIEKHKSENHSAGEEKLPKLIERLRWIIKHGHSKSRSVREAVEGLNQEHKDIYQMAVHSNNTADFMEQALGKNLQTSTDSTTKEGTVTTTPSGALEAMGFIDPRQGITEKEWSAIPTKDRTIIEALAHYQSYFDRRANTGRDPEHTKAVGVEILRGLRASIIQITNPQRGVSNWLKQRGIGGEANYTNLASEEHAAQTLRDLGTLITPHYPNPTPTPPYKKPRTKGRDKK